MMYQPKRQSAAIMALVFFVLAVFPVKRSDAFAPAALVLAPQFVNGAGALIAGMAGLAAVMGMPIMMVALSDSQGNSVRVPLGDKPENQPAPPVAPAGATSVQVYNVNGRSYSDYSSACDAMIAFQNSQQVPGNFGMGDGINSYSKSGLCTASCTWTRTSDGYSQSCGTINLSASPTIGCPSGYSMVQSSCVLQNARQAQDDKACDLLYAQGAFSTADDMNCGASADGTKLAPMIRDGKVIAYGTNSSGQPLMWQVTPGAQTITVKEIEQIQTATQTQIKTTTATIDAATSAVVSVSTETAPGSMASPSGAASPTTLPQGETTSPVNTPTVTQDTTKPIDIQWPSDYARTGEAKNAADSITELMKPTTEVNDPTVPDWADHWGATFNPLKAWSMPGHSSQCPVSGFSWNGVTYTIDSHCQLITDHWSGLQTAAVVVWTITALFIMLGA